LVGAGLSVAAGFPTWLDLLDTLHARVVRARNRQHRTLAVGGRYLGRLQAIDDVLWRAQEYRRLLGEQSFATTLGEQFQRRRLPRTTPLRTLASLKFRHYLTTNYDDLIEQALRASRQPFDTLVWGTEQSTGKAAQFVRDIGNRQARRQVVYLHGRYDAPQTCVIADADYYKRYVATDETQKRLFAVFLTHSILFVGFSMNDPELTALLRIVRGLFREVTPWHYAIMPLPANERVEVATAYYQYRFGVTPIFYEATPRHEGLTDVLEMLRRDARRGGKQRKRRKGSPVRHEISTLPVEDPDDLNKGKFGGRSRYKGWTLRGVVVETDEADWFHVSLTVTAPHTYRSPDKGVRFHLHETFTRSTQTIQLREGAATLERYAFGAFTVGVEAANGAIRLELDLADLPRAPRRFRER